MEKNPTNGEDYELELVDDEPSEEDLEHLKDLEDDGLQDADDAEEESDDADFLGLEDADAADSDDSEEDEDEPIPPLMVGGFDSQDEDDDDALREDDAEAQDDDDDDFEAEVEEDLNRLMEERLADENSNGQAAQAAEASAKEVEWSCDECFLIVSASQFGSPKNPQCPSDELNCPLLDKFKVK